jgi:sugar-specific transcriptional regulator TrmB
LERHKDYFNKCGAENHHIYKSWAPGKGMEETLLKLGLTKAEIKVYLTMLKLKSALAGEVTKMSGLHRRSVYDAIERLIEKGLVSYIVEGKRKRFQPESPERLRDIIHNWKDEVEDQIPKLNAIYSSGTREQEATVYRGKNGLKTIMDDILDTGQTLYVYGAYGDFEERLKYFFAQFEKKRIRKRLHVKVIFDENDRARVAGKLPLVSSRFLPAGFSGPVTTEVYGEKVLLMVWEEEPIILMVKNPKVAKAYRRYFNIIWDMAKK